MVAKALGIGADDLHREAGDAAIALAAEAIGLAAAAPADVQLSPTSGQTKL